MKLSKTKMKAVFKKECDSFHPFRKLFLDVVGMLPLSFWAQDKQLYDFYLNGGA